MSRFQKFVILAGLALAAQWGTATASPSITFAPGYEPCARNCGQISQVGNSLVVTLLDKSGKAFKAVTHDIDPAGTKLVVSPVRNDVPMIVAMGSDDITTQTTSTTMRTTTHIVVIQITYVYRNGQLIDVKIQEYRYPRMER
jgi:hypothetical protein